MRRRVIGVVASLLVATAGVAGDAGAATLAGGSRQDGVAVAVVPTGRLQDPSNRFFQTFASTGGGWSLTTPRGTATNGGLIVTNPLAGAVAVLPFDASHVSAVLSLTRGRPSRMGRVVQALAGGPTALTVNPSSGGSALVSTTGQVMTATSLFGRWHQVVRIQRLAAVEGGRTCALSAVTAAAAMPDGTVVLGGQCASSGWSGVVVGGATGRWTWIRTPWTGPSRVLRLDPTADGVMALVVSGVSNPSLRVATVTSAGVEWSAPLRFHGEIRSTSSSQTRTGASSDVVGLAVAGHVQAWRLAPSGAPQRMGPALSSRVQTILIGAAGRLTAFSVDGRTVTPLELDRAATSWIPQQRHVLPLPYGTSG